MGKDVNLELMKTEIFFSSLPWINFFQVMLFFTLYNGIITFVIFSTVYLNEERCITIIWNCITESKLQLAKKKKGFVNKGNHAMIFK